MIEGSSAPRRETDARPAAPVVRGLLELPFAVGGMAVRRITAVVRVASEVTIVPLVGDLGAGLSRLTLAIARLAGAQPTRDRLADAVERLDEIGAEGGSLERIA